MIYTTIDSAGYCCSMINSDMRVILIANAMCLLFIDSSMSIFDFKIAQFWSHSVMISASVQSMR